MTTIALTDLWNVSGAQYAAPGKEPTCESIHAEMRRASALSKQGLTGPATDMYSLLQQHNQKKCSW